MAPSIILATCRAYWQRICEGPANSFMLYWRAYGKQNALFRSFYFWASIFISAIIDLINLFSEHPWQWQTDVISVIPTIFGFSLGGFAILVGFGNDEFRRIICYKEDNEQNSLYVKVNASFFHFIFVQFLCLFYTIIVKATGCGNFWILYCLGTFLFVYSLFTIVMIAFAVLKLASWFDMLYPKRQDEDDK